MENTNNFQCDENVNFRWYLDMFKDDEMTWKIFFQMMKDMISFLDLVKSKKLIFDLLEELKGFKDKFSELEKSNDVLRKENENLKNELKTKSASNVVINENHKDLSNNSEDLSICIDNDSETTMEIVTNIKIEEENLDKNMESISKKAFGDYENSEAENDLIIFNEENVEPDTNETLGMNKNLQGHPS